MKNNWLITQTVVGLVASFVSARAAEVAQPTFNALSLPTNELIALELGRADATRDVNNKLLRIPMYGLPAEWSSDFSQILEEKYQVHRYGLGGCLVSQSLLEYARGYSEISEHALREKFGSNFFERVQAEAKQAYDKRIHARAAAAAAPVSVVAAPTVVAPTIAPAHRTYRVKPGDTFWEIAKQHRVPVSSLIAANPGVRPERLQINHSLNLPSAD